MNKTLRPHQEAAIAMLRQSLRAGKRRPIIQAPTGMGKCLGRDTPVLMFDGRIILVQNIKPGDLLMGPDSKPRTVLSICTGIENLYRIIPTKGDPYVVNESHILSLKMTESAGGHPKHSIANISVRDYLKSSKHFKHCARGWRTGVDFPKLHQNKPVPPYVMGIWLGDGTQNLSAITTADNEVETAWREYAQSLHDHNVRVQAGRGCKTLFISSPRGKINIALSAFRDADVVGNKHIPDIYKIASREDRLELIAGILDADGYLVNGNYDLVSKYKRLADDIVFIARSLGLAAYAKPCKKGIKSLVFTGDYWRICISGDTGIIPCRVERRKAPPRRQKKSVLVTGIRIESIDIGDYYGFEIDGDRLFMLGDFTVTHNTVIASAIVEGALRKGNRVIFVVPSISLVDQTVQSFFEDGITDVGVIQGAHEMTDYAKPVQVASVQTLARRKIPHADIVVIDECHVIYNLYETWFEQWNKIPFIGLSATPWSKGLGRLYDDLIIASTTRDLIDAGHLVPFRVYAPAHPDLTGVRTKMGDYREDDLGDAMDKAPLIADVVDTWIKLGENRPTFVFAVNRVHAKHLQKRLVASGIAAEYLDGFTDRAERAQIARRFHSGETKVVCNVGVLTTGIDWDVRCIVLARPTKSEILFTQTIGRGLRTAPGKDDLVILDHSDTHSRLGFVTDIIHESLDDGKIKEANEKRKNELLPKECPICTFLRPPRTQICPACGFKTEKQNTLHEESGELVEIGAGKSTAAQKRNRTRSKEQKQQWLGELMGYARQKGFKDGWALHKYKEYFSVWPNKIDSGPLEPGVEVLSWIRAHNIRMAKAKSKFANVETRRFG